MCKIILKLPISLIVLVIICYLSFFKPSATPQIEIPNLDKVAHFCMYFGLSMMVWVDLFRYKKVQPVFGWTLGFILPVIISGVIEILQSTLTSYRGGDWFDFLANSLGALSASLFMHYLAIPYLKKKL